MRKFQILRAIFFTMVLCTVQLAEAQTGPSKGPSFPSWVKKWPKETKKEVRGKYILFEKGENVAVYQEGGSPEFLGFYPKNNQGIFFVANYQIMEWVFRPKSWKEYVGYKETALVPYSADGEKGLKFIVHDSMRIEYEVRKSRTTEGWFSYHVSENDNFNFQDLGETPTPSANLHVERDSLFLDDVAGLRRGSLSLAGLNYSSQEKKEEDCQVCSSEKEFLKQLPFPDEYVDEDEIRSRDNDAVIMTKGILVAGEDQKRIFSFVISHKGNLLYSQNEVSKKWSIYKPEVPMDRWYIYKDQLIEIGQHDAGLETLQSFMSRIGFQPRS